MQKKDSKLLHQAVLLFQARIIKQKDALNLSVQSTPLSLFSFRLSTLFCHDVIFCHCLCVVRVDTILLHEDVM